MKQFIRTHKGPIAVGVMAAAACAAIAISPHPASRMPQIGNAPVHALTCADLPVIERELDGITNWLMHYGWIILLLGILGLMKAFDIVFAVIRGTGNAAVYLWRTGRAWIDARKAVA
jgi:hypothetical protein